MKRQIYIGCDQEGSAVIVDPVGASSIRGSVTGIARTVFEMIDEGYSPVYVNDESGMRIDEYHGMVVLPLKAEQAKEFRSRGLSPEIQ